jgi:hypothetical protein
LARNIKQAGAFFGRRTPGRDRETLRLAPPIVVRRPGGKSGRGDPGREMLPGEDSRRESLEGGESQESTRPRPDIKHRVAMRGAAFRVG